MSEDDLYFNRDRNGNGSQIEEILLPHPLPLIFTVLLGLVFVIGVTGNILTSITIARTASLHSSTNLFLCNLAVSDTLLLIFGGAPFDIMLLWFDNRNPIAAAPGFCQIRPLLAETASSVSVGTIVIVTVERYLAICQPFSARHYQSRRRVWLGVLVVWLVSLCPSIVIAYQYKYNAPPAPNATLTRNSTYSPEEHEATEYGHCVVEAFPFIYEITFFVFFVLPMIMIAVAYALIVRQIHVSLSRQSSGTSTASGGDDPAPLVSQTPHIRTRYMVIKMLSKCFLCCPLGVPRTNSHKWTVFFLSVVVVTVFFFTHLPMHIQRLMFFHIMPESTIKEQAEDPEVERDQIDTVRFFYIWYNVAGILQFGGAASNPFMYTAMSRRFRLAFQRFIGLGHYSLSTAVGTPAPARANHVLKPLNSAAEASPARRQSFSRSPAAF